MKAKSISMILIVALASIALSVIVFRSHTVQTPASAGVGATIYRTSEGFSPSEVFIRKGESIVFINSSEEAMWPASDMHPTHEDYPLFDPREPIAPGDSWTFVFENEGVWLFHDHLRSSRTGKVRVDP